MEEEQINVSIEIKKEIMDRIMRGIFEVLDKHQHKLQNPVLLLDILFSILVITNTELLARIIYSSNSDKHRKRIMKDLFDSVNEQLTKRLKSVKEEELKPIRMKDERH